MNMPIFNANEPVDLAALLVMGMSEFFSNHFEASQAMQNFANCMAGVAEDLCSEKGREYLDKGRAKYQQMFEAANAPDHH